MQKSRVGGQKMTLLALTNRELKYGRCSFSIASYSKQSATGECGIPELSKEQKALGRKCWGSFFSSLNISVIEHFFSLKWKGHDEPFLTHSHKMSFLYAEVQTQISAGTVLKVPEFKNMTFPMWNKGLSVPEERNVLRNSTFLIPRKRAGERKGRSHILLS